jgi:hypothetical protein
MYHHPKLGDKLVSVFDETALRAGQTGFAKLGTDKHEWRIVWCLPVDISEELG